jgi:hypothetical protein
MPRRLAATWLVSRLGWPSILVRERAAVAIVEALGGGAEGELIRREFWRWWIDQDVEWSVAVGLLVLIRAHDQFPDIQLPRREVLARRIKRDSLLTRVLMDQLYENPIPSDIHGLHSESAPANYVPPPFFEKYSKNFIPPCFTEIAHELDETLPFLKQWGKEWELILKRVGMIPEDESLKFMGRSDLLHRGPLDFPISEV